VRDVDMEERAGTASDSECPVNLRNPGVTRDYRHLLLIDDFGLDALDPVESRDTYEILIERHGAPARFW